MDVPPYRAWIVFSQLRIPELLKTTQRLENKFFMHYNTATLKGPQFDSQKLCILSTSSYNKMKLWLQMVMEAHKTSFILDCPNFPRDLEALGVLFFSLKEHKHAVAHKSRPALCGGQHAFLSSQSSHIGKSCALRKSQNHGITTLQNMLQIHALLHLC